MAPTKVFLTTRIAQRQRTETDQTYICYEPTTPPWDKEIICVQDTLKRTWFAHESNIELTRPACQALAEQIKEEYAPRSQAALQKRLHNPLIVQIVLCQASSLDELSKLLGTIEMQRPAREAS